MNDIYFVKLPSKEFPVIYKDKKLYTYTERWRHVFNDKDNIYDNIIDSIEWLIKENYFNKEYLKKEK